MSGALRRYRPSPQLRGKAALRLDGLLEPPELMDDRAREPGASRLSCIATLANTILGTGILELPHAFSATGLYLGAALLLFFAAAAGFTLHLLAESARTVTKVNPDSGARHSHDDSPDSMSLPRHSSSDSFAETALLEVASDEPVAENDGREALLPAADRPPPKSSFYLVANAAVPRFAFLIDLAVMVKCFGVAVSYLVVVGDMMPDAVRHIAGGDVAFWTARETWVLGGWLVVVPLAFSPTLDALKYTSAFAVLVVIGVMIMIVLYALVPSWDACDGADDDGCPGLVAPGPPSARHAVGALTLFIFSFTCHQNIFTICNEITRNTRRNVDTVIGASIGLCFGLCLLVAIAGYESYGDTLLPEGKTNVLTHYPTTAATTTARIALTLLVLFSFPLQAHPSRASALSLLDQFCCQKPGRPAAAGGKSAETGPGRARFLGYTAVFLVASLAIALATTDLGLVMGVVGALGSTTVAFILPGAVYYNLHPWPHWKRYGAAFCFCMGCLIMPTALVFIFL